MAHVVRDLWPEDIGLADVVSPRAILEEQARALESRTSHKLDARVSSIGIGDVFTHTFYVELLGMHYEYELFRVVHKIGFYPLEIYSKAFPDGVYVAVSEDDFVEGLRELFSSDQTRQVIKTLLAQT